MSLACTSHDRVPRIYAQSPCDHNFDPSHTQSTRMTTMTTTHRTHPHAISALAFLFFGLFFFSSLVIVLAPLTASCSTHRLESLLARMREADPTLDWSAAKLRGVLHSMESRGELLINIDEDGDEPRLVFHASQTASWPQRPSASQD